MIGTNPIAQFQALFSTQPELARPLQDVADPSHMAEMLARIGAANGIPTSAAEIRRNIDAALASARSRAGMADAELSDADLDAVAGGTEGWRAMAAMSVSLGAGSQQPIGCQLVGVLFGGILSGGPTP
ncbi:hypothetical protein [Azospirillum thermophilum]|uniref:Nif11 domain-containing protein n=1 Tax=Azospirillum thermophilum TaxID=2202148 RepID=A0A2S2CWC7_9PROT|nr:hypothetical protein [Azospirillum thermophilum]AWK88779.1 hypothetical protein DEW08_22130 [Azospirillum thermophilum]